MEHGDLASVTSEEDAVAVTKMKEMQNRIKSLERILGRKIDEVEILKEAICIASKKTNFAETVARSGRVRTKSVTTVLEVSRSNLMRRLSASVSRKSPEIDGRDLTLKEQIRKSCDKRPRSGYPRVTALHKRKLRKDGFTAVNHKKFTE